MRNKRPLSPDDLAYVCVEEVRHGGDTTALGVLRVHKRRMGELRQRVHPVIMDPRAPRATPIFLLDLRGVLSGPYFASGVEARDGFAQLLIPSLRERRVCVGAALMPPGKPVLVTGFASEQAVLALMRKHGTSLQMTTVQPTWGHVAPVPIVVR